MMGWQLTMTNHSVNGTLPVMPVIPTPSTFYTATSNSLQHCPKISYHVQDGDTLQSIAFHFSVSEERIKEMNNLNAETMAPNAVLLIPVCESTPTNTLQPPTFTITPFLEPITRTPG
jgi:spore germination protein YaaH